MPREMCDEGSGQKEEAQMEDRPLLRVLFLCTGNSCRSIMAEALARHLFPPGMAADSAGSKPTGAVNPKALATLVRSRIPAEGLESKSWETLAGRYDLVVTLCDSAAGESCPLYLSPAVRVHWGLPDPAKATGSEEEIDRAFLQALGTIRERIEVFLARVEEASIAGPRRLPSREVLESIGAIV
ncbi:MAG: arsenate reductase ArsC [Leptospirales bacterium]